MSPPPKLKQLRSVASLQSYEIIVQQGSMNLLEQQRKIYDIFHGNAEINMISQLERLVNGRDRYANVYDIENRPVQTFCICICIFIWEDNTNTNTITYLYWEE